MDPNLAYRQNIFTYFAKSLKYIVPACILGISVERATKYVQTRYNLSPLISLVFQLILAILVLFVIEKYVSAQFATNWQSTSPGLFFVSIYFSLQPSLYDNISRLPSIINMGP